MSFNGFYSLFIIASKDNFYSPLVNLRILRWLLFPFFTLSIISYRMLNSEIFLKFYPRDIIPPLFK